MDIRPHLKALGFLFSLMVLVTVVTTFVALRLQSESGGTASPALDRAADDPAAGVSAPGGTPIAASAAESEAIAPQSVVPAGGQCSSGATSLVESQAMEGNIDSGLGAIRLPTATVAAP